ncbi:hypothetical protein BCR35DRAFT_147876 [Leucosporidium creatinivorum]|uniref:BZIP domain-containing protein n=1 Tax=Leucosporidium creatinivorum TaxID=106004 RepID=A0A1Y2ES12_9BASI|nr:hypothetical protein BCR35DRAFT_147876 [Leucosporidium creatinivorum]
MNSAAAAAGEKPKAKRGRKQDNTLPPSRSRDMQRAFRARKAEHLAQLEAKVVRLEQENNELRAKLGMAPRPPTPPPSAEGGANPTAVPSPSESASSQNPKVEEPATPSDVGAGIGRPSSNTTSPAASVSPVWRPTPMEPPLPPQQQLPSPINYPSHPNGEPSQWEGPAGYPRPPQPPQHDLAMLASLATHPHPQPYPLSSGPYPPPLHPSAYENHQSYAQAPYPPHSALGYPPSQASPSFPYPTNRLPPMSMHHGSPTDTTPSPFRPSHQSSFTRSEPLSTPTPPANPCQPDSRACPPHACAPASSSCGPAKSSCGPASKGCGPSSGGCGPPKPASACLAPPAARGLLPPINSIIDTLPDLDLSPLAALGTYIRPTPLRPPTPDPTLADRFLDTYCTRPTTSAADSVHPPFASPSSPYRTFLLTLLRGLELTGKGPCERESFTPEEEMQLNTPTGEECCGGIVDCTGSLFEEQIFYEENGQPRMKDGWFRLIGPSRHSSLSQRSL